MSIAKRTMPPTEREVERLIEVAKQNRSGAPGRHGDLGCLPPRPQSLRRSWRCAGTTSTSPQALACAQGQGRGCQCASDISQGKSGAAQAPARSTSVALRLHLGTWRTSFRSRISAHGGQGGRGCEIQLSRSFPHLRHACGFKLANDGHDTRAIQAYLGHRSIMSTVHYTALTPHRFKNFSKD
jgi:hypothetical protein